MMMKLTYVHKRLRVSYIMYIAYLPHVSATLVAILMEVHYKGNITETL